MTCHTTLYLLYRHTAFHASWLRSTAGPIWPSSVQCRYCYYNRHRRRKKNKSGRGWPGERAEWVHGRECRWLGI